MTKPQKIFHSISYTEKGPGIEFFNEEGYVLYTYTGGEPPKPKRFLGGTHKMKYTNKKFALENGITAKNLCSIIQAVVVDKVMKKYPLWDKMYWHKNPYAKSYEEFSALEHYDLLEQCKQDSIMHIAPFVLKHGKTPAELKKKFGKSVWKSIASNSLSKNKQLANYSVVSPEVFKSKVSLKPSCYKLVHSHPGLGQEDVDKVREHLGYKSYKAMHKAREVQLCFNVIYDTKMTLGNEYNPKWSYRRIKEEHDKIGHRRAQEHAQYLAKKDAEYAALLNVDIPSLHSWMEEFEMCGIKATPLKNMQEIMQEGDTMHHCVGSYAKSAAKGIYVVWHLQKGDEPATLGVNVQGGFTLDLGGSSGTEVKRKYVFQQMYGVCNKILEDEDFKTVADHIIAKMQKALDEQAG